LAKGEDDRHFRERGCRFNWFGRLKTYKFVLLSYNVIPAKAGIQWNSGVCAIALLDLRGRGYDGCLG
jgi:hypothetical protein